MPDKMNGYEWIHTLRKETGKRIPELLALSRTSDPYFAGSKMDTKQAEWFAKMWEQKYKGQTGIHIRRVHYHLFCIQYKKLKGNALQKHVKRLAIDHGIFKIRSLVAFGASGRLRRSPQFRPVSPELEHGGCAIAADHRTIFPLEFAIASIELFFVGLDARYSARGWLRS
jgi:hypothetical protein